MGNKQDIRKTAPNLHLLYVKWAVIHLKAIDKCMERLGSFYSLNLLDITEAMRNEREKLVRTNKAYADGQEILTSICL